VKPDDLGHGAGHAIAKMTVHRIFDHFAQLVEGIALGNDAVPQGRGHIAAINLVFLHFEDDLAHRSNLGGCLSRRKPPVRQLREIPCPLPSRHGEPMARSGPGIVGRIDSKNALRYKLLGKSELWIFELRLG
jgi:hypothetical protein